MKTLSRKFRRVFGTMVASLVILISHTQMSKGATNDKMRHNNNHPERNVSKVVNSSNQDWASDMTAGWALHLIKHTRLN